jgi:hypothetical protein
MDVAEFDNKFYFLSNTFGSEGKVIIFDPDALTVAEDFNITAYNRANGYGIGINGGIATDAGNGRLFVSDGSVILERISAGNYVLDRDVSGAGPPGVWWTDDSYSMVTDWENDIIFHGVNGYSSDDWLEWQTVIERDNNTNAYSLLMDEPEFNGVGAVTYCNLFNHTTGALLETFGGHYEGGNSTLISKPNGGTWTRDGKFPGDQWDSWYGPDGSIRLEESMFATQSMAPMGSKLYMLTRHWHQVKAGGSWIAQDDHYGMKLWRRDSKGSYTCIWTSPDNPRWTFYFDFATAGICAAPPPVATAQQLAMMRRAHEVN